ncbi:MAG TPA: histidinol-phosphate transaminase, partial [Chroococcidiopsis sp.]
EVDWLRRYSDPTAGAVRQAVSRALGVPPDWVLVGNGSDDLLTMIVRACLEPGNTVVYPTPTYTLYRVLARIQAAECVEIPYDDDYRLPLEALIAAQGTVTMIASPNSPSGTAIPLATLETLVSQATGLVVIDEAYADFAEENALGLVARYPHVIVLRTLSKGYSLAGLRLGFAIAQPSLLEQLGKVKDSYNVDAIACAMGAAAIADQDYKNATAAQVKVDRAILTAGLEQLGCRVWPSQANFVLTQPPRNAAAALYQSLKAQDILVRYFDQPRLADKLRITVGTASQNQAVIQAIAAGLTQD